MKHASENVVVERFIGGLFVFLLCLCVSIRPLASGMTAEIGSNLIFQILIFFCAILWITRGALQGSLPYRSWPIAIAGVAFLLICAFWTTMAPRKLPAIVTLMIWGTDILLLIAVVQALDDKAREMVLACLMASAVVAAWIGITQYLWGFDELRAHVQANPEWVKRHMGIADNMWPTFLNRINTNRAFGTFVYPNALAGFLNIVLPISLGMCFGVFRRSRGKSDSELSEGGSIDKIASILVVIIMTICLLFSFSKGGWIATAAACFFFAATLPFSSPRRLWIFAVVCVSCGAALLTAGTIFPDMPNLSNYFSSFRVRLDYWETGWRMVLDNRFIGGVGLKNFGDFYTQYKQPGYQEVRLAHSTAVQLLVDMGIVGLASYAILWFLLLKSSAVSFFSKPSKPVDEKRESSSFPTWAAPAGGLTAFMVLALARDTSPFTLEMGKFDYSQWFICLVLWLVSFAAIRRMVILDRPEVRAGLAAGCVGFLIHGMVDFDMFVPGVHQAALLAGACGCALPLKTWQPSKTFKLLLLGGCLAAAMLAMACLRGFLPIPDLLGAEVHKSNAQYFAAEGKPEEAIEQYIRAAVANPLDDEVHASLSILYWNMAKQGRRTYDGQDVRTLALKSALASASANPRSSTHRAQIACIIGNSNIEEAVRHAREAVRLYPARPKGHILLGDLLTTAGREEQARLEYAEALRLHEFVTDSWLKISQVDLERLREKFLPETP